MAQPFLGEVKMVSFNFAPKGWALCNGQTMAIAQNQALFAILGITYGGNGTTTFNLPNLQGRVPLHMGPGYAEGQVGGAAAVALAANQAGHGHPVNTAATANSNTAGGNFPATAPSSIYGSGTPDTAMNPAIVSQAGGNQAHPNLQPYLVINFVIALTGIFPSRN
jgi:microcystin-dependent protein